MLMELVEKIIATKPIIKVGEYAGLKLTEEEMSYAQQGKIIHEPEERETIRDIVSKSYSKENNQYKVVIEQNCEEKDENSWKSIRSNSITKIYNQNGWILHLYQTGKKYDLNNIN